MRLHSFRFDMMTVLGGVVLILCHSLQARNTEAGSFDEMVASKKDLWGEAAMRQPNGPSYEFFEKLLPPLRYVDADYRFYPILLSAPNAKLKAHLISNGSGVNLRGRTRGWHDIGTPVLFRVGPDEFQFGGQVERVTHPTLLNGFLPIIELRYFHPSPVGNQAWLPLDMKINPVVPPEIYRLEAFASTDPKLADHGMVLARFSMAQGSNGILTVVIDSKSPASFANGRVTDDRGDVLAYFNGNWKAAAPGHIQVTLTTKAAATVAIPTKPLDRSVDFGLAESTYERQRESCIETWTAALAGGMQVETPEPIVNHACRALLIQNFGLIRGDRMHYSTRNQYDGLYEGEGSDAALAFLVWGYDRDMRRLMVPLLDFTRKGLEFHQAGFKIGDVVEYYWHTRDAATVKELRPRWEKEAQRLDSHRTGEHGLFPREQYCGDVHTKAQSATANSKAWRALRDLGAVLTEIGDGPASAHYAQVAADFRKVVLKAIDQSARRDISPPFVPVALYTNEPPHDPITEVRLGSYWNLIIGYLIGSGIFPPGSEEEHWVPHYLEQHGGLAMGMIRAGGAGSMARYWNSPWRINPLYGTRYALDALRRDDPDRSLVAFYGMLAQGFTRNTFHGGEGCALTPLDPHGRFLSLPPNSAANAHFLSMLRYLLVQDFDFSDDGKPDTLRLCFATPRRWLEDGKQVKVERAPTAFGPVSVSLTSHLAQGEVLATVQLPQRNRPDKVLLRARVPDGWRVVSAKAGGQDLRVDREGTVDLSALSGPQSIRFAVAHR